MATKDIILPLRWSAEGDWQNILHDRWYLIVNGLREFIDDSALLKSLQNLPEDSYLRIISSPRTFNRLWKASVSNNENVLTSYISRCIDAEMFRSGQASKLTTSVWTANCDLYIPNNLSWSDFVSFQNTAPNEWTGYTAYRAPLIEKIPVDFVSPCTTSKPSVITGLREYDRNTLCPFSFEQYEIAYSRILKAWTVIATNASQCQKFLASFVSVITCSTDSQHPQIFLSESSNEVVGRITLLNPHVTDVNISDVVSALIHEAIHSYLYSWELRHPFVLDRKLAAAKFTQSPWTGKLLSLHSFLHACFVWYGIAMLWSSTDIRKQFPQADVMRHMRISTIGFIKMNHFKLLHSVRTELSDEVITCIVRMQKEIQALSFCNE
ncbi:hypothetical protein N836_07300 [Leptolyngbya sp. Heron Island J]|uniref:aKG-HExxH-type peptide beta-hydroxylase n=1 Tax=Leptolyngbya sp. Heron Island J TaxID=1385935 RepID=UPI0003B98988|nr:HEXXH motif-containing putative peptide modification protein [Leptolyngbya sp. Heron Island J]ESA36573.1 hypothetical protein N836_07300 [Leptolyngbya sp. Heron Island J]